MKIYNRGGRTITTRSGAVSPGKWLELPAEDGAKLIKMFPRDLVADTAKDAGFPAEIEALRKENADLRKENAELRELLAPAADVGAETPDPVADAEPTAETAEEEPAAEDLAGESENAPTKPAKKARRGR
jgi:hypothetical protein